MKFQHCLMLVTLSVAKEENEKDLSYEMFHILWILRYETFSCKQKNSLSTPVVDDYSSAGLLKHLLIWVDWAQILGIVLRIWKNVAKIARVFRRVRQNWTSCSKHKCCRETRSHWKHKKILYVRCFFYGLLLPQQVVIGIWRHEPRQNYVI